MTEQTGNQQVKPAIDSDRVVRHLNRNFDKAIREMGGKAVKDKDGKPNLVFTYQVEFAYMIDEIQRGPIYLMPKVIADANELITKIQVANFESKAKSKK